ncbi:SDR family oxidoreductase [Hyphomonas johnsonii]|uniref:NAD(P)-binding domain-containing protein n=1 Tax=Hyphomonas johnsonii MHS-2 TaxID=1280950 RepID=A0A059FTV7_9PROT|nr:SDR family oxidoreductase [Hyphomonas johnsonii]KCZ94089.1 hypothetical protein HJO_01900 [Hyphomonas johnsonii MHS-2]
MRIVVVGGTGLIGSRLVSLLHARSHHVVVASRSEGIDALSGQGLATALRSAHVVVDVTNTTDVDGREPVHFFETITRNLISAEAAAGVNHHVALSIVGADKLTAGSYFEAKAMQEEIIKASPIPYTIVRSTQFFELIHRMLGLDDDKPFIRLPRALLQPIASDDVAMYLADIAVSPPRDETIELAGPARIELSEVARLMLSAEEDPRRVIVDPAQAYFGTQLAYESLLPGPDAHITSGTFSDWLRHQISPD